FQYTGSGAWEQHKVTRRPTAGIHPDSFSGEPEATAAAEAVASGSPLNGFGSPSPVQEFPRKHHPGDAEITSLCPVEQDQVRGLPRFQTPRRETEQFARAGAGHV